MPRHGPDNPAVGTRSNPLKVECTVIHYDEGWGSDFTPPTYTAYNITALGIIQPSRNGGGPHYRVESWTVDRVFPPRFTRNKSSLEGFMGSARLALENMAGMPLATTRALAFRYLAQPE